MGDYVVPEDRRYTRDHLWAKSLGDEVLVGLTKYAVVQMGLAEMVVIDVEPGAEIATGRSFGTIETNKAVFELFGPIHGKVCRVNSELRDDPGLLNDDDGEGWLIAITPSDESELNQLLDAQAYSESLGE
jgi:glycine cleavage system H protein